MALEHRGGHRRPYRALGHTYRAEGVQGEHRNQCRMEGTGGNVARGGEGGHRRHCRGHRSHCRMEGQKTQGKMRHRHRSYWRMGGAQKSV